MPDELAAKLAESDFKEYLLRTAGSLYDIERPCGFEAFERSARYCLERLEEGGAEEVELLEFPADGRSSYWDCLIPPAWYPESARLTVTSPAGAFSDPVIADYEKNPLCLAMWSAATPPSGIESEIITENMMLAGHSARGKFVLTEPAMRACRIYSAVCDRGGAGIVSDGVRDPCATPDGVFWENAFREREGWYPGAGDRDLVGFSVPPRIAARVREILHRGKVNVHAEVKATKGSGRLYAATGLLKGASKPEEEIWLAAHLFEPLGTDNCVGAAVAITVCRLLGGLMERGELPRPERSIRVALTLECYGFTALLKTLRDRGRRLAATFVLDSCATDQGYSGRPISIHLSPSSNPLYSDGIVKEVARAALEKSSQVWQSVAGQRAEAKAVRYEFRTGYFGNDAFLGDPMAGGPSFHFYAREGPYWHNSDNTFDIVSPELLAAMVPVHAALAYRLGRLRSEDAPPLAAALKEEGRDYLDEGYDEFLEEEQTPGQFARAMQFRLELLEKRFQNLNMWVGDGREGLCESLSAPLAALKFHAEELFEKADAGSVDPDGYNLQELSKVDRRALNAVFRRTEPTFPMSQTFVDDIAEMRETSGHLPDVLARMDGAKHLLRLLEEEEFFGGRKLNRRGILGDCLFLARRGYLEAEFKESVGRIELVEGLRRSGVEKGDLILAHCSLSAFGHVDGGVDTVIDALLEAVGPEGTLLIPAFTRSMIYFEGDLPRVFELHPWHPEQKHCWTGAISEAFLERPAVMRSMHPTHSVAGTGPLAGQCLGRQGVEDPPTGSTSAFASLVEHGGKVVYFGTGLACSTFLHYLETKLGLPYLTDALCVVLDERGEWRTVHNKQHLAGHRDFYRGGADWREAKIFKALKEAGLEMGHADVGLGEVLTVEARDFEEKALRLMREHAAILLCDSDACLFCRQWRGRL